MTKILYELDPSVDLTYSVADSEFSLDQPTGREIANRDSRALERAIGANICDVADCDPRVVGEVISHEQPGRPVVIRQKIGCLACTSDCAQMTQTPVEFGAKVADALHKIKSRQ